MWIKCVGVVLVTLNSRDDTGHFLNAAATEKEPVLLFVLSNLDFKGV